MDVTQKNEILEPILLIKILCLTSYQISEPLPPLKRYVIREQPQSENFENIFISPIFYLKIVQRPVSRDTQGTLSARYLPFFGR